MGREGWCERVNVGKVKCVCVPVIFGGEGVGGGGVTSNAAD